MGLKFPYKKSTSKPRTLTDIAKGAAKGAAMGLIRKSTGISRPIYPLKKGIVNELMQRNRKPKTQVRRPKFYI